MVSAFIIFLSFKLSPWPSTLLIRYAFNKEARKVNKQLEKHVPNGIQSIKNVAFESNDKDSKLDIHYPSLVSSNKNKLPVIVWIHGGGLISGNKNQVENYSKILASKGFVVVAIDYTIAPEAKYPKPLHQTNAAIGFLKSNAEQYNIDSNRFIIAGDSGGALIAAQIGNIIYNSDYASLIQMIPSLRKEQLVGLVLHCGIYNIEDMRMEGDFGNFMKTVTWAYSGKKDYKKVPIMKTVSVTHYIDSFYPPVFISAGNGDPLLNQSLELAQKLNSQQLYVDTLFFPKDLTPALPHEYQFNLDTEAGQIALERTFEFLKKVTE
jgi:acetyl esterase/lipase